MIQLINCNSRDMSSYYSGCTLVYVGKSEPVIVNVREISSRTELLVTDGKESWICNRSELRVHYFEPFYHHDGSYHGFNVDRSYKRAPTYPTFVYKDLLTMLMTGTLPSTLPKNGTCGRIGHEFFVLGSTYSPVVYRDEPVGVFSEGVFYVPDACIAERLKETLAKEGIQYDVVQTTNRA